MNYTHGGTPEKNTKRVYPYGVRVEGKAYPNGETPLGVQGGHLGDLPGRDVRDEAMGRHSESARIEGERRDDGGTLSSSFRFMECVGAVVGTSA
jgi:hypothetical protein